MEAKMNRKSIFYIALFAVMVLTLAACSLNAGTSISDLASLVDGLVAAGVTAETGDDVTQQFFSPTGQIIRVNGEDVQVFEYESAEAAEEEAALVSEDGSSIGTTMVTWVNTPHFYRAGNLIVLYVGENEAVVDALESLLGEQFAGR
jgi:hypothetical protein